MSRNQLEGRYAGKWSGKHVRSRFGANPRSAGYSGANRKQLKFIRGSYQQTLKAHNSVKITQWFL